MNFKKITAIATSVLMTGMTVGMAAAANYPAPFVDNGVANVAVVYGTGAGVSSLDMVQAGNIQTSLGSFVKATGTTTVEGGDSYKIEKKSANFNLGDTITGVLGTTTLDEGELPLLLAEGTYTDSDNDDFDYSQEIELNGTLQLEMFSDSDYNDKEPTLGFYIADGQNILTYTLDFSDTPLFSDLETTYLPIMGKEYYVLDATNTSLTLLDSAASTVLSEGETTNVAGKQVSIEYISDTEVKFSVDGEITNSLSESETVKLKDGSYLGVKDILYASKDTGISKVEFSIGNGKLIIGDDGDTVEMNEDNVDGITSNITGTTTKLESISIAWAADDELFVTEDSEITMPGFEAVKFSYGGIVFPAEENIVIENDGDDAITLSSFPMIGTTEDIAILAKETGDTNFTYVGSEAEKLLSIDGNFDKDTNEWMLVSWNDSDESESYLLRAINFDEDTTKDKNFTDIQYRKDGAWVDLKTDAEEDDEITLGEVVLTVGPVNITSNNKAVSFSAGTGVTFDTLYSKEGMKVDLSNLVDVNATTASIVLTEEDKDDNLAQGDAITVNFGITATDYLAQVSSVSEYDSDSKEIESSDVFESWVYSELATKVLLDQSETQDTVTLVYHGSEAIASVYVTSADATVSSGASALGDVLVKDSEVSSVATKNLVIVGGSCINSAAATVLGVSEHTCGEAFTAATGVGAGEFLIKGVEDAYTEGKLALVVAGYDAADTANAATYLTKKDVDTSKEYKGTSETTAEVIVA